MNEVLEKFRITNGPFKTSIGDSFGAFFVPVKSHKAPLKVISSSFEDEWQHVSVSLPDRCPTWNEMALVKNLFYGKKVTVIQYHPNEENYVNNHPYCLHLWKKRDSEIELPPSILVGVKELGNVL